MDVKEVIAKIDAIISSGLSKRKMRAEIAQLQREIKSLSIRDKLFIMSYLNHKDLT